MNNGGSIAKKVKSKIFLSDDNSLDANDKVLRQSSIKSVKPGGSIDISYNYIYIQEWIRQISIAVIDPDNTVIRSK